RRLLPFLVTAPPPPHPYTLSLHDALPISIRNGNPAATSRRAKPPYSWPATRWPRCSPPRKPPCSVARSWSALRLRATRKTSCSRSEEHTSELQSRFDLVCRLLLEKKKEPK